MTEAVIDAGELLDARDRERDESGAGEGGIEGERGGADLKGGGRAAPVGARVLVGVMGVVVLGILSVLAIKAYRMRHQEKAQPPTERIEKRVPALKVAPLGSSSAPSGPPVPHASTSPAPGKGLGQLLGDESAPGTESPAPAGAGDAPLAATKEELVEQRRLARGFGTGDEGAGGVRAPADEPPAPPSAGAAKGGMEEKLEVTELKGTSATVMPDREYWLTQGAMLDCVLETRIVSTVAGMVSCHLTRDAYSTNGRLVLLDRGTRLVGRYQAGMQQGESRIFVVWTRAETPNGVIVTLDSPGTGALGEAGVGGWVDKHFWDRFGAAILVSLIQSGTDAAAARLAGPARNATVSLDPTASATKDVVARTYDSTINMPPTLYVNQGERIGVFVARDLNFRGVYGLEHAAAEQQ